MEFSITFINDSLFWPYFYNICFLDELDTSDYFWEKIILFSPHGKFHNFIFFFLNEAFPKHNIFEKKKNMLQIFKILQGLGVALAVVTERWS